MLKLPSINIASANLVLADAIERIFVKDVYADISRGIFLVRGENVLLLGEIVGHHRLSWMTRSETDFPTGFGQGRFHPRTISPGTRTTSIQDAARGEGAA